MIGKTNSGGVPLYHATRHARGGADEITPASIGAVWGKKVTASLPVASWSSKTQTVTVQGVTASNDLLVAAAPASTEAWAKAGVYASAQTANKVTFKCTTVPTAALTANILILEGVTQ